MRQKFNQIFSIMDEAFPDYEMRTYEGQKALLNQERYRLIAKEDAQGNPLGFLAVWEFEQFCFVEHLAVSRTVRNGGIGANLLKEYLSTCKSPVVLEVEPPENEIAARRIRFYERLGFHLNSFQYEQPPLREGCKWCPLFIMSYPNLISEQEFAPYKEEIYEYAYRVPAVKK